MFLNSSLKKQIDNAKVISFDIFDTLLLRPYVKPTDLFLHMEKLYNCTGFAKARIEAEHQARRTHKNQEDITIDEIYDELSTKYKPLKLKELALEQRVLSANPELKEVYDYVKTLNKRIIIISDMYLPTDFLANVLKENGYTDFEKLYVSGNCRKKKGTGTIYKMALSELKLEPYEVLHIGDNCTSDYNVPQDMGIPSVLYPKVITRYLSNNEKAKIFLEKYPENLEASIMIMNFSLHWLANQEEDFWSRIGYEYGGPMCYAYMRWVEKEVLNRDIREILFVARDGYSLQKVFDSFGHKNIKTHYIYAPRQLYQNCNLQQAAEQKGSATLGALKYYQEKDEKIEKLTSHITTESEAKNFIIENKELFDELVKKECVEYENYIKQQDITENKIALVDTITGNLSSQRLIDTFLPDGHVVGLYWNIIHQVIRNFGNSYDIKQWGYDANHSGILCWDFVEYMMTSPEAPIYTIKDNKVIYKNNISKHEIEREKRYITISESIVNFANDMKEFNFSDYDLIKEWVNLLFTNPSIEEKSQFSKVEVAYDASHDEYRSMYNQWGEKGPDKTKHRLKNFALFYKKTGLITSLDNLERRIKTKIYVLGIPLLKIIKSARATDCYMFGLKIMKYRHKDDICILKLLGLPILRSKANLPGAEKKPQRDKNEMMLNRINRLMEKKLSTFAIHQHTFPQFKGINAGKDIVIVATGPTLAQFKPIQNAVYIGVNRAVQFDKIHYDYYFIQDYSGATPSYIQEVFEYKNCIKFMGLTTEETSPQRVVPELYAIGNNIFRYRTDWEPIKYFETKFAYDLSTTSLGCGGTVVFPALQFALWTHPKRIYLVGCDTNTAGYFDATHENNYLIPALLKQCYQKFKSFAEQYYPDVEIVSINPVGLKGIFKDVYQE